MYKLKRIVVGLDLSALDETIIRYTALFSKLVKADKIYFIHVSKNLELPEEILEKYPDLIAPVDETIEKEVESSIKKYFDKKFFKENIDIKVSEGNPFEKLLKWAKIKEADCVILGLKKGKLKEEGLLPRKITNLAPCSVLLIPEDTEANISKIMVPVDFSKYSNLALEQALSLSKAIENSKVICQHIYSVPSGYHTTGKSYEDFAEIMRNNALKHFERFKTEFKHHDQNLHCEFELDRDENKAVVINNSASKHKIDLMIIGSRGRTEAASILLGSIAEKLLNYSKDLPLLIVKKKGENMTFLKALLEI
jgi:nucleotide-binding universal stress UspA family protein